MASALDSARQLIEARIESGLSGVSIAWPDRPFAAVDTFVQPAITWGEGTTLTLDPTGLNETVAVLTVNVFTLPGTGDGAGARLCDTIRDAFADWESGVVRMGVAEWPIEVRSGSGHYRQRAMSLPFTVLETT